MPSKSVELTVEVYIDTVTCPGVWLCPEGQVSLAIFTLGSSHQTATVDPTFPLLFKDTFYFKKRFKNSCSIGNIQCALRSESIYCELVQWDWCYEPCVLAQYLGSLSDVLFPPNNCAVDGVDLLMRSTSDFPGILSPKIELSTKIRVDEVYESKTDGQQLNNLFPIGSAPREKDVKRQKPVCHSKEYHWYLCSAGHKSPLRKTKAIQTKPENQCICNNDVFTSNRVMSVSPATENTGTTDRVAYAFQSDRIDTSWIKAREIKKRRKEMAYTQHRTDGGPCTCEICQRYHQLFHLG